MEKRETKNNQDILNNESSTDAETASSDKCSSFGFGTEAKDYDCISSSNQQRPKIPGLQRNIEVLKAELLNFISEHGQEGFMPMRKQLRKHGRVDIEKAITRMGGFRKIASLMDLSLAYKQRKPKGYWDNLENLQDEVSFLHRILFFSSVSVCCHCSLSRVHSRLET